MAAGGVYMPDKEGVHRVRTHIARYPDEFADVIGEAVFEGTYGDIRRDRLKRIPPEFKDAYEVQPLVANKQWYFMAEMGPDVIVTDRLPEVLMDHYLAGQGVAGFLREALSR